jgi:mannose-6-phosphate isomerase-like protein (cupin superfamily)
LSGTANTVIGGVQRIVNVGGSFHIPRAVMYQVSNVNKTPLEILEVRVDATPIEGVDESGEELVEVEREQA